MLYVFAYIQNRLIRRLYVTLFENPTKMSPLIFRPKKACALKSVRSNRRALEKTCARKGRALEKACAPKDVEINIARFARNVVKMRL